MKEEHSMEHWKNDEGIKGGSSGIHLADANSIPCLQVVYKWRESFIYETADKKNPKQRTEWYSSNINCRRKQSLQTIPI